MFYSKYELINNHHVDVYTYVVCKQLLLMPEVDKGAFSQWMGIHDSFYTQTQQLLP